MRVPGPGHYREPDLLSSSGKFVQSTKKSVAVPKLSTSEKRFKYRDEGSPGPGEYTAKEEMESNGAYFISKYGSSGAPRFGKSGRSPIVRNVRVLENPGPG